MHRASRGDRGQSLVIVLSLITLFFLLGSALAVHASVALRATRASDGQGDDFYAADAATELGIWWQRNGKAGNPPAQTINGITTSTTVTSVPGAGGSCPADNKPIWLTGFESGWVSGTSDSLSGAPQVGPATADASVVRTGSYSAQVSPAGGSRDFWASGGVPYGTTAGTVEVLHFAFQFGALPSADASVNQIWTNGGVGTVETNLYYKTSSGKWAMTLKGGGAAWSTRTEVEGSLGPVAGQWQTFDIRFQNFVNPAVVDWSVNGVAQPQHTRANANWTTTGVKFGQSGFTTTATYTGYFDDIMISKTSSDYPLGDIRINGLKPNGMGTHNTPANYQQTVGATSSAIAATSWQTVDEIPMAPASTNDYIKEITAGAATYIELAFEDTTQTCVRGASLFAQLRSTATQANNVAINSVTNAFNYTVWSGAASIMTSKYVQGVVSQNASTPGTGPWTQSIVNGIVARFGMSTDVAPVPYLDAIVLEYAWMNVAAGPATVTIVGTGGGSTVNTSYSDAGAAAPTLSTWTATK
jgi:Tfp pilus assembly protein PilX